jgi:hypothetical protein
MPQTKSSASWINLQRYQIDRISYPPPISELSLHRRHFFDWFDSKPFFAPRQESTDAPLPSGHRACR